MGYDPWVPNGSLPGGTGSAPLILCQYPDFRATWPSGGLNISIEKYRLESMIWFPLSLDWLSLLQPYRPMCMHTFSMA